MTESVPKKPNIAEISPHLICALCGGYLIDATTIVECLHSFCKTCIVRYLESSKYCPICEVLVHKTRPLQNIRLDQTLQNIVYKLVPGLFQGEMKRRREFYKDHPTVRSAKTRLDQQRDRIIYSANEQFSISLEFCHDGCVRKPSVGRRPRRNSKPHGPERRYLLCPAGTTVALIKKFMRLKFALPSQYKVDLFHADGPLRDHYSLMDIAYIYSWKREGVLQLYYSVYILPEPVPQITITEIKTETTTEVAEDGLQRADDTRPSSLFSKASLLGNHSMDGNLHHDLSPLELIATVANDISCLQEGRGLKRKIEVAQLYENDDDNSSTETQIKKTVERAIDLCSTSVPTNVNQTDSVPTYSKPFSVQEVKHRPQSSPVSFLPPYVHNNTHTTSNASFQSAANDNRFQQANRTSTPANNSRQTVISKGETKEKPKKTDTASQCDPRPKKQKTDSNARPISHSKAPNKGDSTKSSTKSVDGTKSSNKMADSTKSSSKIVDNTKSSSKIVDNTKSSSKMVDSTKLGGKPVDNTKSSSKTVDSTKSSSKMVDNTKSSSKTVDRTKSSNKMVESTKSSSKTVDNSKLSAKVNDYTKSSNKSVDNTKSSSKSVDNTKSSSKTVDNTKSNNKTVDNTKSSSKTNDNTKSSSKTVDNTKLSSKTVDNTKSSSKTVDNTKLSSKTVDNTKSSSKTVDNTKSSNKTNDNTKSGSKTIDNTKLGVKGNDNAKTSNKSYDNTKSSNNNTKASNKTTDMSTKVNSKSTKVETVSEKIRDAHVDQKTGSAVLPTKAKSNGVSVATPDSSVSCRLETDSVVSPDNTKMTEKTDEKKSDTNANIEMKVEAILEDSNKSVEKVTGSSHANTKDAVKQTSQINGHASSSEIVKLQKQYITSTTSNPK